MTAMRAGSETGSLINHVMSGARAAEPAVGMGATVLHWSDRTAGTIVSVESKAGAVVAFTLREDKATRTDGNGMSDAQSYSYAPNPEGTSYTFRRVARGKAKGAWRERGLKGGHGVLIGFRDKHHDYSF